MKSRTYYIANVKSGWAVIGLTTTEIQPRDAQGRFTEKKVELDVKGVIFRASSLTKACERLSFILRNSKDNKVILYLGAPTPVIKGLVHSAIPCEVVDVTYIKPEYIRDRSTPLGMAFSLAREAYTDSACPVQDHNYACAIDINEWQPELVEIAMPELVPA